MELKVPRASFATWLKQSHPLERKESTIVIGLPNNFAKAWVEDKYCKDLLGIMRSFDDTIKRLEFLVAPTETSVAGRVMSLEQSGVPFEDRINLDFKIDPETNLNSRYTLSTFVVGPSNELAHAAATAVVQEVGVKYNPFFIYGGVGLGKTHLLQAIGNEIRERYKGKIKPRYVTSEKFTNDVVWALRNKRMEDMKRRYRDVDVLIIDDIQFIGGKEKTEEEFFHTFNALYGNNKQIIISSDRPPQAIPTLEERLRSRFEGGLIADINYPEYETRVAIIKNKLQDTNHELSDAVIDIIAKRVKKNVREIEGVLNKVIFYQDVKKMEITEKIAEDIVEKSIQSFSRRVSDDQILKSVAEFFNISAGDLITRGRKKEIVEPRQIAMYLLRDILEMSYPYIGEKLGRDHTTAIHAVEKISSEINKNHGLNQKLTLIKELIYKSQ